MSAAGFAARAINHLLEQQPSARAELAAHGGAAVRIAAAGPLAGLLGAMAPGAPPATGTAGALALDFTIGTDGRLQAGAAGPPRVALHVELSPSIALDWLRDGAAGAMRRVRIDGDAALATAIAGLAKRLRWDIEEDLSRVVGDLAAHRLARTAHAAVDGGRDLGQRARTATISWLVDEQGALVDRAAFESLRDDLRRLRDDIDRLGKRVERLRR